MTVELAVLVPPAIVVALIVFNLMGFLDACAVFDQASLTAVVAHGVAPAGTQTAEVAEAEVAAAIRDALGREEVCEVEVRTSGAGEDAPPGSAPRSESPGLRRGPRRLTRSERSSISRL